MGEKKRSLMTGVAALSLLMLGAVPSSVFAETSISANSSSKLKKRIDFILKENALDRKKLSIAIYSLSRQEFLYSLNPDTAMNPASAVKLLTAAVVLKKLGPEYTFKTQVFASKKPSGGALQGDLILVGSGDPSFVTERAHLLADQVIRSGVKKVSGDIWVDDWAFDQVRYDESRIPTTTDRPYNAPVGALSFNYNTTTVYVRPGEKAGAKAKVFVEPDTGFIKIDNKAQTVSGQANETLQASRVSASPSGETIRITGSIPITSSEVTKYFNVVHPARYSGFALRFFLKQRGVEFTEGSQVLHKPRSPSSVQIAELESLPLRQVVTLMNKFSNNFIADVLVKTLGREVKGSPGSVESGIQVLNEESLRMGIRTEGFKVVSGSGLTRDNRMSSQQFVKLFNKSYRDFEVLPELLSSLPIAGRDGTLSRRMKDTKAFGVLRAKTGTINGVSSLVGAVQSAGGELIAFSLMINDDSKNYTQLRNWQDHIANALSEYRRD